MLWGVSLSGVHPIRNFLHPAPTLMSRDTTNASEAHEFRGVVPLPHTIRMRFAPVRHANGGEGDRNFTPDGRGTATWWTRRQQAGFEGGPALDALLLGDFLQHRFGTNSRSYAHPWPASTARAFSAHCAAVVFSGGSSRAACVLVEG
jgi:hypothetical protein